MNSEELAAAIETPSNTKSRATSKRKIDWKKDLERFEELKRREKELEADIPPNRIQKYIVKPEPEAATKIETPPSLHNVEEGVVVNTTASISAKSKRPTKAKSTEVNVSRRTRSSARVTKVKVEEPSVSKIPQKPPTNASRSQSQIAKPTPRRRPATNMKMLNQKFKELTSYFNSMKPKYLYTKPEPKDPFQRLPSVSRKDSKLPLPPKLSAVQNHNSFEEHVIVTNTYNELINKIREGMENSSIDISLHHNLVAKNLEYEKNRFSLKEAGEGTMENTANAPGAGMIETFSAFDIDLFFNRLSQGSDSFARRVPLA